MAYDALALFTLVLRDLVVEVVMGIDRHFRIFKFTLSHRPLLRCVVDVPAGPHRLRVVELLVVVVVVVVDHNHVTADLNHDGLEYGLEGLGAGEDDFATTPRAFVELVRPCIRW